MALPSIPGCRGRVGGFVLGQPSSLNAANWAVKRTLRESDRAVDAAGAAFDLVSRCPNLCQLTAALVPPRS